MRNALAQVPKIIVTGSGKSGTTFFMELLTELGFDTGYEPGKVGNGEWKIFGQAATLEGQPRILKTPWLCEAPVLLDTRDRWDWHIERVYVLLRDYDEVADSRWNRHHIKYKLPMPEERDDLWQRHRMEASRNVGDLMLQVVSEEIPYTFLLFPRIVLDPEYLWFSCELFQTLDYETFKIGFDKVADLSKVHWGLNEQQAE